MSSEPAHRLVVIAARAIADVELIADHRKQHRVGAEQQLSVGDRVVPDVGREFGGAAAVPAGTMSIFGVVATRSVVEAVAIVHGCYLVCWGTYPGGSAAPSPKKKSSMCLATSSCASFCHGIRRYSLRIIFMRSSQSFQPSAEMFSKIR